MRAGGPGAARAGERGEAGGAREPALPYPRALLFAPSDEGTDAATVAAIRWVAVTLLLAAAGLLSAALGA